MHNQQLREQLAAELRRQKLPESYIERLLEELDDHFVDLQEERNANMQKARTPEAVSEDAAAERSQTNELFEFGARIGDPAALAAFASKQHHRRSFFGRHPTLTFLLLPVPIVLLQIVGVGCLLLLPYLLELCCGIDIFQGLKDPGHPVLGSVILGLYSWAFLVLPPLVAGLLLCRIARKNSLNWRWPTAAVAMISIYCGVFFLSWQIATSHNNGLFMLGVYFPLSASWIFLKFLPKVAVAAGIGGLLVWRSEQLRQRAEIDNPAPPLRQAA